MLLTMCTGRPRSVTRHLHIAITSALISAVAADAIVTNNTASITSEPAAGTQAYAAAVSCNDASNAWSLASQGVNVSSAWGTIQTNYENGTAWTASITTLCDGKSRILGDLTSVSAGPLPYTWWNQTYTPPAPDCTIDQSNCARLSTSYLSALSACSSVPCAYKPQCSYNTTTSSSTTTSIFNTTRDCGACTIYGGHVQLLYFPETTSYSKDMCATAPLTSVTCPFGTLASAHSSNSNVHFGSEDQLNGKPGGVLGFCNIIIDSAYRPFLAVPPQYRAIDPAWSTCVLGLDGLWDPPRALSEPTTEAGPSVPGGTAVPAQTTAVAPATTSVADPVTATTALADSLATSTSSATGLSTTRTSSGVNSTLTIPASSDTGAHSSPVTGTTEAASSSSRVGIASMIASVLGLASPSHSDTSWPSDPTRTANSPIINASDQHPSQIASTTKDDLSTAATDPVADVSAVIIMAAGGTTSSLRPSEIASMNGFTVQALSGGGASIQGGHASFSIEHLGDDVDPVGNGSIAMTASDVWQSNGSHTTEQASGVRIIAGSTTPVLSPGQATTRGEEALSVPTNGAFILGAGSSAVTLTATQADAISTSADTAFASTAATSVDSTAPSGVGTISTSSIIAGGDPTQSSAVSAVPEGLRGRSTHSVMLILGTAVFVAYIMWT